MNIAYILSKLSSGCCLEGGGEGSSREEQLPCYIQTARFHVNFDLQYTLTFTKQKVDLKEGTGGTCLPLGKEKREQVKNTK